MNPKYGSEVPKILLEPFVLIDKFNQQPNFPQSQEEIPIIGNGGIKGLINTSRSRAVVQICLYGFFSYKKGRGAPANISSLGNFLEPW